MHSAIGNHLCGHMMLARQLPPTLTVKSSAKMLVRRPKCSCDKLTSLLIYSFLLTSSQDGGYIGASWKLATKQRDWHADAVSSPRNRAACLLARERCCESSGRPLACWYIRFPALRGGGNFQ